MAVSIHQDSIDAMLAFNHLMNRLASAPVPSGALRGILAVSKLRLIREVLEELDLGVNGPEVMLKGNNAFFICYCVLPRILACLGRKFQDPVEASIFVDDLRKICSRVGFSDESSSATPESPPRPARPSGSMTSPIPCFSDSSDESCAPNARPPRSIGKTDISNTRVKPLNRRDHFTLAKPTASNLERKATVKSEDSVMGYTKKKRSFVADMVAEIDTWALAKKARYH